MKFQHAFIASVFSASLVSACSQRSSAKLAAQSSEDAQEQPTQEQPTQDQQPGADDEPRTPELPVDMITLNSIIWNGSGCPVGREDPRLSDDRLSFALVFDRIVAERGPGIPLGATRKNCQILFDLSYPDGWTYALKGVRLAGAADLDAGLSGKIKVSTYFQGQAQTPSVEEVALGSGELRLARDIADAQLAWAPCDAKRALNINTQVLVQADQGASSEAHGRVAVYGNNVPYGSFELVWKRCD